MTEVAPLCIEPTKLVKVTVCTRPFRAQGPRIEAERLGNKLLIHNYGHGGAGWSLSWGSAALVVPMALVEGTQDVAVIGCGALGLTSAISLQRAGVRVTIYARDLPAETRSARATGTWTPDARVALKSHVTREIAASWERMARSSHRAYMKLLDLPGRPVAIHDRYTLSDELPEEAWARRLEQDALGFSHLEHLIADLYPSAVDFGPGQHPFLSAYCRKTSAFRFNIAAYSRYLEDQFRTAGGELHRAEFHTAADLVKLRERVIVHCTGYGARALFTDATLIPVRGQISWLPPQPDFPYSLVLDDLNLVPRADGTVVQWGAQGDATGWQDPSEEPDEAESATALAKAASLCRQERRPSDSAS